MISSSVLAEIKQKKQELKQPEIVKMSESTWELLCQNELAKEFGDIDTGKHAVFGIKVMFDNSLRYGVTRIYISWASATPFPL